MRVEVMQEDIDRGGPQESASCPIALAICHATGSREGSVHVGRFLAGFCMPGETIMVPIPATAMQFVERFDKGEPVAPFAFDWPEYDRAIEATAATKEAAR